jgi:hypothetical protein
VRAVQTLGRVQRNLGSSRPGTFGVVEAGVSHEVLPVGNVLFYVEFWR